MGNRKDKIRIAVIGCGWFARHFVPLFQKHPFVEEVFVCDLIAEKAQFYKEKFGTEIIGDFDTVLADERINAVAVFTQRHTHGDLVSRALLAGVPTKGG